MPLSPPFKSKAVVEVNSQMHILDRLTHGKSLFLHSICDFQIKMTQASEKVVF